MAADNKGALKRRTVLGFQMKCERYHFRLKLLLLSAALASLTSGPNATLIAHELHVSHVGSPFLHPKLAS